MFFKSVAICIAMGSIAPAVAENCLPYEPATVTVIGRLSMAHGYGPAGFGEDPKRDSKEEYALLTLDKATCVSGGQDKMEDDDVKAIDAFQLVHKAKGHLNSQLIGTRVAVSGTLLHRVSGGHTEAMIMYTDVRKAP
jgi:hypothetical protein